MKYRILLKSNFYQICLSNKMNELIFEAKDYNEIDLYLSAFEKRNNIFMRSYTLIEVE